jgi:hypothetical protein
LQPRNNAIGLMEQILYVEALQMAANKYNVEIEETERVPN